MKHFLLGTFVLFGAICSSAQDNSIPFCSTEEYKSKTVQIKSKVNGTDSLIGISIRTKCKAGIFKGWKSYSFFAPELDLSILDNPTAETSLYINKKPFTGFVKTIRQFGDASYQVFQFNKGKFESMETISSPEQKPEPVLPEEVIIKRDGMDDMRVLKPVLYLYPTHAQAVEVKIALHNQEMIHPYPAYGNGWKVTAQPDGTLKNNQTGKEHYCLFWETEGKPCLEKLTQGFVVEGKQTAAFLENTLERLGLSAKEANEFIIFWLPQMENNAFNAIYFASNEYEQSSQLQITPKPDTQIRVMMMWKPLTHKVNLPEQLLPDMPKRKGFVAVEWGGSQVSQLEIDN